MSHEFDKGYNLKASLDEFLLDAVGDAEAEWNAHFSQSCVFNLLSEDEPLALGTDSAVLQYHLPVHGGADDDCLRDLGLTQFDVVTKKSIGTAINRFLCDYIFFKLGLVTSRRSKEGFIPLKRFWDDKVSPITEDQIIVRQFDDMGWQELLPGQEGSPLKDSSVIHYYATLLLKY